MKLIIDIPEKLKQSIDDGNGEKDLKIPLWLCHSITHGKSVDQIVAEIEKLPRYAAKFADGELDIHISRTDLMAIIHKYTKDQGDNT